jgi:hypothetical protein
MNGVNRTQIGMIELFTEWFAEAGAKCNPSIGFRWQLPAPHLRDTAGESWEWDFAAGNNKFWVCRAVGRSFKTIEIPFPFNWSSINEPPWTEEERLNFDKTIDDAVEALRAANL